MTSEDRNRKSASIEQLLIWAYHDQVVHQARRDRDIDPSSRKTGGPLAAYSTLWDECAPVDASRRQGFEAAPDAWRIHDLVMGLGHYQVDCGQDLAAARYHRLGQYRGAEPPVGCGTVDQSARPWPTDGKLVIDLRALVMIHASRATRPALPGRDPLRLKPAEKGAVWHPHRKTKVYAKGWYCHVAVDGDLPGDRIEAFEVYSAWRDALELLQAQLKAVRLTMFDVSQVLPAVLKRPEGGLTG